MTRCVCLVLVAACAGCQSWFDRATTRPPALTAAQVAQFDAPVLAAAVTPIDPPKPATGPDSEQHLNQAVALLEKGNDAEATIHLQKYVAERPDQLIARANLGELLFRQRRFDEAHFHFELFIAMAQEQGDAAFRYLIHCHSRLVEMSEEKDPYEEHLNRGIGLYLLARRRATEPDATEELSADSLLCKAAAELQEARGVQPVEARPHLYLYRIWSQLGQQSSAKQALALADANQLLSRLTPLERRELQMACLSEGLQVADVVRRR